MKQFLSIFFITVTTVLMTLLLMPIVLVRLWTKKFNWNLIKKLYVIWWDHK
jgi:hypothetical protein